MQTIAEQGFTRTCGTKARMRFRLEMVTRKIERLTVFGGLDGVIKQLVTLK